MPRPPAPVRRLALALALLAFVAMALPARAEDVALPPPAAVEGAAERLTPEEVAVLRRRLPEWDRWDAAARDRVAAGVVRLRGLTPEQRARVFERGRRLDRAGPVAAETFAKNLSAWSRFGPDDRQRVLQADVTARAFATEMFAGMPASVRDPALATPGAPGGWGPGMRASLGLAISRAWRERALATLVAAPSLDHEPAASAPPARAQVLRDLREKVRAAGGERAPEDLRRRYAHGVLEDRVAAARHAALKSGDGPTGDRAKLAAYGKALRELDVAAFDAVAADVRDAASRGPEGLERFRDRFLPGRPAFRARGMWELVWLLEARRRELTGEPLAKADDLVAALLTALEVPDEQVRALRAESRPGARQRLLREMKR